ncbi:unnamed protein product [Darwinula stevensoni]|uniref:Elongation of very long chain fatty acids protein n=1 Tax=Darwinula stevensoni TaxID=69355 RepID=A0A7R9A211_9CRUS|nr:unnamed protein product [Darwinula stevensoni]CAG0878927.1 unnamed protein product [Darwinula stevensoni]
MRSPALDLSMFHDPSAYPKPNYPIFNGGIPFKKENLPYFFVFEWELAGEWAEDAQWWFMDYWTLSFVFVALYLILVFWSRRWMASRPPYDLQKPLIAWNFFFSVFSILAVYRGIPEVYRSIRHDSLYYSMCLGMNLRHNPVASVWAILFVISKVVELGDKAFIGISTSRYFVTLNALAHAFMYPYYTARAAKVHVPRRLAMAITLFQITQMIFGIYANAYAYFAMRAGLHCETPWENIYISALMYLSYFLLFLNFFVDAYLRRTLNKMKTFAAQGTNIGEELTDYLKIN